MLEFVDSYGMSPSLLDPAQIEDRAFKNLSLLTFLDLSANRLTGDSLTTATFEGPYTKGGDYMPLSIIELNLGHNRLVLQIYKRN